MALKWIVENPPQWDEPKAKIVGGAPEGIFETAGRSPGELVPG